MTLVTHFAITCGQDLTRLNEGCTLEAKPDRNGKWEIGRGHDIPPSPGNLVRSATAPYLPLRLLAAFFFLTTTFRGLRSRRSSGSDIDSISTGG